MAFHAEVMPALLRSLLERLGRFATERGFYLGGGTATAIHLGHRQSVDLDWFTAGDIADPLRLAVELKSLGIAFETTSVEKGTLHGEAAGVNLSFLAYRYPTLVPSVEWPEFRCRLASLEDLACMKLSAVAHRGAKRDFIDILALGRSHFTLDQMLDLYQKKFDIRDPGHALMALTYFDDADAEEMPAMLWDVDWDEVKRTIEAWVRDHTRRQTPPHTDD